MIKPMSTEAKRRALLHILWGFEGGSFQAISDNIGVSQVFVEKLFAGDLPMSDKVAQDLDAAYRGNGYMPGRFYEPGAQSIGDALKKLQQSRGFTDQEVALHLGVSDDQINEWVDWEQPIEEKHLRGLAALYRTIPDDIRSGVAADELTFATNDDGVVVEWFRNGQSIRKVQP